MNLWFQKVLNRKWRALYSMGFPDSNTRAREKLWGTCVSTQAFGIIQTVDRGNTKTTGQQLCIALQFMAQYCIVLSTLLKAENSSLPVSFPALEGLQILPSLKHLLISSGIGSPCKIPHLKASLPYTLTRNDYSRRMHQGTGLAKMKQFTSWWLTGTFCMCLGKGSGPFRVI